MGIRNCFYVWFKVRNLKIKYRHPSLGFMTAATSLLVGTC